MKFNQLRAFEKHLAGASPNHFSLLYLILGKEAFQRKMALDKLTATLIKTAPAESVELQTFDAEKLSAKALMDELNAMGLFASKRAILIEGADKLDKELMSGLEKYFEKPNPSTHLILSASSLHHGSNFYKKIEKMGIILEFLEEKPWEKERSTQEWIGTIFTAEGKTIDPACCQQMVKLLGTQQELLYNEIQKLICYVGDRPKVTLQDISAIISSIPLDTGFQLGEAVFRRDGAEAMRICKGLLMEETPLIVLLRQLRFQFQTEFQVCSILAQGGGASEISRQFPYMKGAVLERHIALAQGYGMQNFRTGLLKIDEAEMQAKNSNIDANFIAELLIIKLTTKGSSK